MCGIVGYAGPRDAKEILISGLKRLEYRGYDSWGIAGISKDGLFVYKRVGAIGEFSDYDAFPYMNIGIAHTRWATHGKVSRTNAHPQLSCDKKVAIVHNGIIENYPELRSFLLGKGHRFSSETDSEVIAHLIEEYMKDSGFEDSVLKACKALKGSFAFLALDTETGKIAGARNLSPLCAGLGDGETFISSDPFAFTEYTNKVVFLDDGWVAFLGPDLEIRNFDGEKVDYSIKELSEGSLAIDKGEYEHYMLKEIEEQSATITSIANYPKEGIEKAVEVLKSAYGIFFVAAGSSYHASLEASYIFSKIASMHVNVALASEFPYYKDFVTRRTVIIAVSQSGETADVLDAVRSAKERGAKVLAIVNTRGSTLDRLSDWSLYINAGPEIGVAATKTFTNQVALFTLIAYAMVGRLDDGRKSLLEISREVSKITSPRNQLRLVELASKLHDANNIYVLGRGISYPLALEGALKIKEVSYIHAEGFPGGELKHGTIALIEKETPVIVIAPLDEAYQDIIANAMEIRARGGYIIGISPKYNEIFDFWINVPDLDELSALMNVVPIQILAYYLAIMKGLNPDKPRNLAKSVTVK